mgnify:CR=1 FL=1
MISGLTEEQWLIIEWVNGLTTGLSLLGELFMILSYCAIPSIRRYSMKLVVSLVFTDLIYSISCILTYYNSKDNICFIEGAIRTIAVLAGVAWSLIIMNTSYVQIMSPNPEISKTYRSSFIKALLIGCVPTMIAIIGHLVGVGPYFGAALGFCSLLPETDNIVIVQLPQWICIIVTFVYAFKIINEMKRKFVTNSMNEYRAILIYPLITIICWLPVSINRIIFAFHGTVFPLMVAHIATTRIQGFLNALVYGKSEIRKIKNHFFSRKTHMMDSIDTIVKEIYLESTSIN